MAATNPRPLSPHLTIWRWGPHMTVSILHRATGVALSIAGLAILAWWLLALAQGPRPICASPKSRRARWSLRPDRPDLGLLPAPALGHSSPRHGHGRGVRAEHQQAFCHPDHHRLAGSDRGPVGLRIGRRRMSLVTSATPLGRVRGLGSAREGGEHWLTERVTSIACCCSAPG